MAGHEHEAGLVAAVSPAVACRFTLLKFGDFKAWLARRFLHLMRTKLAGQLLGAGQSPDRDKVRSYAPVLT